MNLESYINKKNELNSLKRQLNELEHSSNIKTPIYTSVKATPTYTEHLTDEIIKIDDLKVKIYDTTLDLIDIGLTLGEKISNLKSLDVDERAILIYRYIMGYKIDVITRKVELSKATVHRKLRHAKTEFGTNEILEQFTA